MDDNQHDGEMIGLHNPANGRSCLQHDCCGRYLIVGELVRFNREVIRVDYGLPGDPEPDFCCETVIKVVVVYDGVESCYVSFLPHHIVHLPAGAHLPAGRSLLLESWLGCLCHPPS
jgi:hypothetical protein